MSHIVHIQTQVRDPVAARAACDRLGLPPPSEREVQLFSAAAKGLVIELPGWLYPVVCDLKAGTIQYDNYGGHWGDSAQLDGFLQAYAVEKSRLEATRSGHAFFEEQLSDGSIKVTIQLGGPA